MGREVEVTAIRRAVRATTVEGGAGGATNAVAVIRHGARARDGEFGDGVDGKEASSALLKVHRGLSECV